MQTIPEVGSKWQFNGAVGEIATVLKVGRGYQVHFAEKLFSGHSPGEITQVRLRDFLKAAKPL